MKGLKDQIRKQLQFSQMAPGVKIMEPLTNQPVTAFEFGFKIRVRDKHTRLLHKFWKCQFCILPSQVLQVSVLHTAITELLRGLALCSLM